VPRTNDPPDEQKVRLFRDSMYYEIVHTFGVPRHLTDAQLADHAIGETINYSRYVHARLLAHFLLRKRDDKGVRDDDVLAAQFGFERDGLGLSEDDVQELTGSKDLNKGLIHLSYGRVTGATSKPWASRLLRDLLPVTIRFMQHIRDNEDLPGGLPLFAGEHDRGGWRHLLDCLESCQNGRRLRFESGFVGQQTWYRTSTEAGSIASLYGAKPAAIPTGAVVQESLTNTTSTVMVWTSDSTSDAREVFESDQRRPPPEG
jgi:hypothetical protein